ncbi:MAG: LytTR family DNA-binding domain-containing protein [Eubacteriales bacterium]
MQVLVLEDNKVQLAHLTSILRDEYKNIRITKCTKASELIEAVSKVKYDLFLIDVEIGEVNSIDILDRITKGCPDEGKKIIYITAHKKHAVNAINKTHCFGYIEKPYSKFTLIKTINACMSHGKKANHNISFLNYKVNGETQSINKSEIMFVEYQNKKPVIHTKLTKFVLARTTIKTFLSKLNSSGDHKFIRCRRSNIINLSYISAIRKNDSIYYAEMENGIAVPIGEKYKMNLIDEVAEAD